MDMNDYKQYEPIFGSWHITRLIGEGSFGKVFEMERNDFGMTYKAALKAITVPANDTELRNVMADGMDEESVRSYYSSFVQDLVKEFALMSLLKGNSNIVSYENHQVIEHKEGIGWDILIQMERLTPLNEYTQKNTITRQDVIRLGIDMCKALELCQKYNIIHRDVKPENMFISDNGDFKLGDFGIARTVEKTTSGLSKKGTYTYMAPEVYKGQAYGSTVDIYSLGIVMYRLLNENRTPFLPAYPAPISHSDRENALAKRFSGAPLPPPSHAEGRLAEIVLKACAYDPKDRYSVPLRMREDLEAILYNREESQYIYPEGDEVPQKSVQYIKTEEKPEAAPVQEDEIPGTVSNFANNVCAFEEDAGGSDGTESNFGKKELAPQEWKKEAVSMPAVVRFMDWAVLLLMTICIPFACSDTTRFWFGLRYLGLKELPAVFIVPYIIENILLMGMMIYISASGKKRIQILALLVAAGFGFLGIISAFGTASNVAIFSTIAYIVLWVNAWFLKRKGDDASHCWKWNILLSFVPVFCRCTSYVEFVSAIIAGFVVVMLLYLAIWGIALKLGSRFSGQKVLIYAAVGLSVVLSLFYVRFYDSLFSRLAVVVAAIAAVIAAGSMAAAYGLMKLRERLAQQRLK